MQGILYLTVLAVIIASLVAIFFIRIDVTVHASGIIKPREDHLAIYTTTSGYVRPYNLDRNGHVNKGDTLLVIISEGITTKLPSLQKRKEELDDLIADLKAITRGSPYSAVLRSPVYKQDVLHYIAQWNEADAKRKQAKLSFERSEKLYNANVIPLSELENVKLEYTQSENAIRTLTSYQKRQWQGDLIDYENELRDILTQLEQISIQEAEAVIFAPTSGTILQTQTLFNGSYVTAGQQVIEMSPDGNLVAECYVQPKDIAYFHEGMTGRVQVSAFNYTEWGVLTGTVSEVFDDVSLSADGKQSFYKLYCSLNADNLTLKNGFKGYIKKGMAVNANFIITRRTIFQLLYDKVDDWLNPTQNEKEDE